MIKAQAILGICLDDVKNAKEITSYDHRVLQDAHDIIAAAYRYKFDDGGQLKLGEASEEQSKRYVSEWVHWLEDELDKLIGYRKFAHSVIKSVIHEGTDIGCQSEFTVVDILLAHYSADDWMYPDGYLKTYLKK